MRFGKVFLSGLCVFAALLAFAAVPAVADTTLYQDLFNRPLAGVNGSTPDTHDGENGYGATSGADVDRIDLVYGWKSSRARFWH